MHSMRSRSPGPILGALILGALILAGASSCSYSNGSGGSAGGTAPGTVPGANSVTVHIPAGAMNLTTDAYGANPLSVPAGATVTWINGDAVAHTVTSDAGVFDSGTIAPGQSFSFAFTAPGSHPYHCTFHPGMLGTVSVGASASPTASPQPVH